ncbi:MAG: RNA polymerase sigma factor [bacterium]|nr:RNA polymerase sigma factor [bacterium]
MSELLRRPGPEPAEPKPDGLPFSLVPRARADAACGEPVAVRVDAEALRGDVDEFTVLYRRHYRRIASYVLRRLGERELVEELTAEVFLRAFEARVSYRGAVPVVSWLLGIATNLVCREIRRRRRERRWRRLTRPWQRRATPSDHASEVADELAHVRALVDELPIHQQEVLTLHCLEELPLNEVATVLGIALGTAKSRLSRARASLRVALESRGGR